MSQRNSILILIIGLTGFLGSLSQFFSMQESWHEISNPKGIAHILAMLVTFLMTIAGALGTQLPRDTSKGYKDRVSDKKLDELNSNKDQE